MQIYVNARFLTQEITGVQRHALELSRWLKKLKPEMQFLTPPDIIHRQISEELQAEVIGKHKGHRWEQFDLPHYLKYKEPALLINLANTAPLRLKNKIVTIHDLGFLHHPGWYSKKFYYFYRFLIPRIARSSAKIITDSHFSKNEIVKMLRIPEEKITVIQCGLPAAFEHIPTEKPANNYGKYILTVSSLDPRKNLEGTVKAFQSLKLPDTKLVIAGGSHKLFASPGIEKLIKGDTHIVLTDYVTDEELIGLYQNAELFVFSSFYEGFGLPPLEAMACGCPCLVSKAASIPEICCDAARYCNPYDPADIASNLMKMLVDNDLRNKLIKQGRDRAESFKGKESAQKLLALVDDCGR